MLTGPQAHSHVSMWFGNGPKSRKATIGYRLKFNGLGMGQISTIDTIDYVTYM